jgi:hypothetical protein
MVPEPSHYLYEPLGSFNPCEIVNDGLVTLQFNDQCDPFIWSTLTSGAHFFCQAV